MKPVAKEFTPQFEALHLPSDVNRTNVSVRPALDGPRWNRSLGTETSERGYSV